MERLRIVGCGGLENKIPTKLTKIFDIRHVAEGRDLPGSSDKYVAIVVVTSFFNSDAKREAKRWAVSNGVPFIASSKWNGVITAMLENETLRPMVEPLAKEAGLIDGDVEPEVQEMQVASKPEPELSEKEIWEAFKESLKRSVRSFLKPEDPVHIDEFLELIAEDIGLDAEKVRALLPRLCVAGIMDNPAGDTWVLKASGGMAYEFTPSVQEVAKPVKEPESQSLKVLGLIKGLAPGPYPSKYAIETELMSHEEFRTRTGKLMQRTQAYRYVMLAIEEGIVFTQDGRFYVTPDDSVKLTRATPKEDAKPLPAKIAAVPAPPADAPVVVTNDIFAKSIVGRIDPPLVSDALIAGIKQMVCEAPWDRFADMTVRRILEKKGISPRSIAKNLFNPKEWDWLAWAALKEFKMEHIAPHLTPCFTDEHLKCSECGHTFVFTKDQQRFWFNKESKPPRACGSCKAGKVAGL